MAQRNAVEPAGIAEPWITTEELARYLRKPVSWLHQNSERLAIPRRRLGNQFRYRRSEVDAWLSEQR